MTARTLYMEKAGDCSGGCSSSGSSMCEVATYAKCPMTFMPLKRKTTRRFQFDFSTKNCEKCCDAFYNRIRTISIDRRNPPDCPPSEGYIRISNESMCRDTGIFSFSVDANDARLTPGERFLITAWASLPDTSELPISAYISIDA